MEKSELQTLTHDIDLYGRFLAKLAVLVAHKYIMKPSGEKIDHWSSQLYGWGDHAYHLVHSVTSVIVPIIILGLLIRVSWKIAKSWFYRSDGTHGFLLRILLKLFKFIHTKYIIWRNPYQNHNRPLHSDKIP